MLFETPKWNERFNSLQQVKEQRSYLMQTGLRFDAALINGIPAFAGIILGDDLLSISQQKPRYVWRTLHLDLQQLLEKLHLRIQKNERDSQPLRLNY